MTTTASDKGFRGHCLGLGMLLAVVVAAATARAALPLAEGLDLAILDGKAALAEVPLLAAGEGWAAAGSLRVAVARREAGGLSTWTVETQDLSGKTRWLELRMTARHPRAGSPCYWPGFLDWDFAQGPYETAHRGGSLPLAAMWDDHGGLAIALEPHERVSYLSHAGQPGPPAQMTLRIRVVLEPGGSRRLAFVSWPISGAWGHTEAVERWQELAPEFYSVRRDVDPRTNLLPTQYAAWPGTGGYWDEVCRRNYGGWEWCYAPFKRTGDIVGRREFWDFQSAAPIPKRSLEQMRLDDIDAFRQRRRELFAAGERGGVQMLFYVPAMIWCEEALAKERYADALTAAPGQINRFERYVTGWDDDLRVLPWHTSYGEQARVDLKEVAAELDLTGYAYDTAGGEARHPGPAAQAFPERAWDDEVGEFVREGLAITKLIEYTQTLRHSSGRRLSVVPNLGLAWYTVGQVADAGMKEASPWHSEGAHNEVVRNSMGAKPVCWWEGYGMSEILRYETMTAEEVAEAYIGMGDHVISESFKWAYLPTVAFTRGVSTALVMVPPLLGCIDAGYRPVPAARVAGASWVRRYGTGTATRLVTGNETLQEARPRVTVDNAWLGGDTHVFSQEDGAAPTNRFAPGVTVIDGLRQAPRKVAIVRCRATVHPGLRAGEATATVTDDLATWRVTLSFSAPVPSGSVIRVGIPDGYRVTAVEGAGARPSGAVAGGVLAVAVDGQELAALTVTAASTRFLATREAVQAFPLFVDSAPACTVVLRAGASDEERLAAQRLVAFVECYCARALDEPAAVTLPIVEAGGPTAGPRVVIDGRVNAEPGFSIRLDGEALVIAGHDGRACLDGMEALLRVLDRKYWYPGGHVAQVQNARTGLAGRWIDFDGSVRGSPAKP